MTVSLNTNIGALRAIRRLDEASLARSQSFERLSTGQRINKASDDAAGLSVSLALNVKARVYNQALRNVNDGISYLNVAEGGMKQLTDVLIRLRELSTQASNGSFSNTQRQALDVEAQALQGEYNRILDSTRFNGISVFESQTLLVQAGFGSEGSLEATLAAFSSVTRGDGTFQARQSFASGTTLYNASVADINGDGKLDLVSADWLSSTLSVLLGNGDGTFQARLSFVSEDNPRFVSVADFNGDGKLDLVSANQTGNTLGVFLGNGDGTFQAAHCFALGNSPFSVTTADVNGDGKLDLVSADGDRLNVLLGNGDGSFQATRSFVAGNGPAFVSVADFNGDGKLDLVSANQSDNTLSVLLGNGDGSFQARRSFTSGIFPQAASVADLDGDGKLDLVSADWSSNTLSVLLGNGDGTFRARSTIASGSNPRSVSVADFNGDGRLDLVSADVNSQALSVFLGNGDGTFQARRSFASGYTPYSVVVADFDGDGRLDLVSADQSDDTFSILLGNGTTTAGYQGLSPLSGVSVATKPAALLAQGQLDSYLDNINAITGVIGSAQSRFTVAARLLAASAEMIKAAESRIKDADLAQESSYLASTGILQQTASAVLAHALKGPEIALKLLQI